MLLQREVVTALSWREGLLLLLCQSTRTVPSGKGRVARLSCWGFEYFCLVCSMVHPVNPCFFQDMWNLVHLIFGFLLCKCGSEPQKQSVHAMLVFPRYTWSEASQMIHHALPTSLWWPSSMLTDLVGFGCSYSAIRHCFDFLSCNGFVRHFPRAVSYLFRVQLWAGVHIRGPGQAASSSRFLRGAPGGVACT